MPFCDACGTGHSRLDNYCRHCGIRLEGPADTGSELEPRSVAIAPVTSGALLPWVPDRQTLVRGIAAMAAGAVVELIWRRFTSDSILGRGLPSLSLRNGERSGHSQNGLAKHDTGPGGEILETIIIHRFRRQ